MRVLFLLGFLSIGGCTLDRIEHDSTQALGFAHLSDRSSIERSTRWRLDDPGPLQMDASYDPNDPRQIRLLRAAYDGVVRVYPQTELREEPAYLGVQRVASEPVALLIHVDIPAAQGNADDFPVALVDLRTGAVIDRATLSIRSSWWGDADDPRAIEQLFRDYASRLRPRQ